MARFSAKKLKNGQWQISGLDGYIKSVISHLLRHFRPRRGQAGATRGDPTISALVKAFTHHPRRAQLVRAGKQKDQLLRSLIPLYVARRTDLHLSSGAISRFWAHHGIRYAPPNAAKALREHVGYARLDAKARQITPNGVRYVETALAPGLKKRAA